MTDKLEASGDSLVYAWTLKTLRGERGSPGEKRPIPTEVTAWACSEELMAMLTLHRLPITGNCGHTTQHLLGLMQQASPLTAHHSAVPLPRDVTPAGHLSLLSWQNPECDPAGRTRITFLTWAQVLEPDTWARLISKEWNACDMRAHILNEVTPLGLTMLSLRAYTIWQKSKNEKLPSELLVLRETPKATKVAAFPFADLPEVEGKSRMLKMLQIWLRWRTRQVWAGFELKA